MKQREAAAVRGAQISTQALMSPHSREPLRRRARGAPHRRFFLNLSQRRLFAFWIHLKHLAVLEPLLQTAAAFSRKPRL